MDSTASQTSSLLALDSPELMEVLASIEHDRWSSWQQHVHSLCVPGAGGSLMIPAHLVNRWTTQILTPYSALSESEKESDREQVRRYLPALRDSLSVD
jgi:hypothetical protein